MRQKKYKIHGACRVDCFVRKKIKLCCCDGRAGNHNTTASEMLFISEQGERTFSVSLWSSPCVELHHQEASTTRKHRASLRKRYRKIKNEAILVSVKRDLPHACSVIIEF